jgi:hypothetical protein
LWFQSPIKVLPSPKVAEAGAEEMAEQEDEVGKEASQAESQTDLTNIGHLIKLVEGVEKSVTLPQLAQLIFQPKTKRRRLWTTNTPEALSPAVARPGQIKKKLIRSRQS